jgi:hypothetical protein
MKKWFIPLVAVLAIAGALFASPIVADDDAQNGRGCGNCPAAAGTIECPRTECPVVTGGTAACPREEGCGGTEGGCGRLENCPVINGATTAGTSGEPEAVCPGPGEEGACPGMEQGAGCTGTDEDRGCGRGTDEGATSQTEGRRGGCGMMR